MLFHTAYQGYTLLLPLLRAALFIIPYYCLSLLSHNILITPALSHWLLLKHIIYHVNILLMKNAKTEYHTPFRQLLLWEEGALLPVTRMRTYWRILAKCDEPHYWYHCFHCHCFSLALHACCLRWNIVITTYVIHLLLLPRSHFHFAAWRRRAYGTSLRTLIRCRRLFV